MSVFKEKRVKKKSQNSRNQVFLTFWLLIEGSGSIQLMMDPDTGGQKHTDPQHCYTVFTIYLSYTM